MSGRITSIAVNPKDNSVIYVGAASGGVWKSESAGTAWEPIFDKMPTQSIGSIEIDPLNPEMIWVGTGEGNPRNSQNSGNGLYASHNGGHSFQKIGLENTSNIHRIVASPINPGFVAVGVQGSAWAENEHRGVYITKDGGKTWDKTLFINETTGIADMIIDPNNPSKIIAAMWDFHRDPWAFRSGGPGSGLYISYDFGETWDKINDDSGLPKGDLGRIGLTASKSRPGLVYAVMEANENSLFKSLDGGLTWQEVKPKGNFGNRPFYYADIFVDPQNENRLYSIHSLVTKSEDGGKTWEVLIPYAGVHPDHHAWWINPENPDHIIEGNDGGLAITYDRGDSWRFVENLPVGQFYHINIDNETPYNIYGGMQDNGSWKGPSQVWKRGGIRNSYWKELMFGDGFDVVPDPSDSRYGYAMWQEGNIGYYDSETGASRNIKPAHPAGKPLRFHWNAAIAIDPFNPNAIYFGSQYLHYSSDKGINWELISPDLTRTDSVKQELSNKSGGLTTDVTGAENYNAILAIAPSEVSQGTVWVGTDDGKISLTRDSGKSWSEVSPRAGVPDSGWVAQLHAHHKDEQSAIAVINDYRRGDNKPYLMMTKDFGKTWRNLASEKGIESFLLSFVMDKENPNLMFLGADNGLYYSLDAGSKWEKFTNGYPSVPTMDMKIHPRENDLVVGTFGRSVWVLDDISYMRKWAEDKENVKKDSLTILSSTNGIIAEYGTPDGTRFSADAIYSGQNRYPYPTLTYSLIPRKSNQKDKEQKNDAAVEIKDNFPSDSIKVSIFASSIPNGEAIRSYWVAADSGTNRINWDMTKDGFPSVAKKLKIDEKRPPSGVSVLPGTYSAVLEAESGSDTVDFDVTYDPRKEVDLTQIALSIQKQKEYEELSKSLYQYSKRLDSYGETIEVINTILSKHEHSDKDSIQKKTKTVADSLEKVWTYLIGESGGKGIVRRPDVLTSNISNAMYFLSSLDVAPGNTNASLISHIIEQSDKFRSEVERFESEIWLPYKSYIESVNLSIFGME
ncbi:MAG: hypothetical protein Kapaf2KO_17460 [Candidatus Kapaibacteriales bacterium]